MNTLDRQVRLRELRCELASQWAAFKAYCWAGDPLSQKAAAYALGRSLDLQERIRELEQDRAGAGVSR